MPERSDQDSSGQNAAVASQDGTARAPNDGREKRGTGQDWSTLITLVLATIIGSMLIVLYVVLVNMVTAPRKEADVVEKAALVAAHELSYITVEHPGFGRVGLCNLPPSRFNSASPLRYGALSLDNVYTTLGLDEKIADQLGNGTIKKMVAKDRQLANKAQAELIHKLNQAVQADTTQTSMKNSGAKDASDSEQDNVVFRSAYRVIAAGHDAQVSSAVEMRISLGRATPEILDRSEEPRPVNQQNFVALKNGQAPYVVRVEAIYERRARSAVGATLTIPKVACALISAPNVEPAASSLALNFPSGLPPQFHSIADIIGYKQWLRKGDWQQAVGSEVPGRGSLAPSLEPIIPQMEPGEATGIALYHWLRACGSVVDVHRAVALIRSRWELAPLAVRDRRLPEAAEVAGGQPVNSCLVRDTEAREYSILNQTAPGSVGQQALCRAFGVFDPATQTPMAPAFPPSALPLFVDGNGNCRLSGEPNFDRDTIRDFLHSLYATNLAAIESLATATQTAKQSLTILNQLEQKILIEKQELASVTGRIATLGARAAEQAQNNPLPIREPAEEPERIRKLAQERITGLKEEIARDEKTRSTYAETIALAKIAQQNAKWLASSTFEVCAHQMKLCRNGLARIDGPSNAFLIGRHEIFVPIVRSLDENDFPAVYETEQDKSATSSSKPREDARASNPWFQKNLAVSFGVENAPFNTQQATVKGKPLSAVIGEQVEPQVVATGMILLDSRAIRSGAQESVACSVYRENAFSDLPIPSGQLLYYCQNAMHTGEKPKVAWTVVIRDLVASRASRAEEGSPGLPIQSREHGWCTQIDEGACPGLACEVQIRCPLPVLDGFTEDWYLKNPNSNVQLPEIPPAPPDML